MSSMAKQKQGSARTGFWVELFQFGLYKPNQGRIVRQVTFFIIGFLSFLAAWEIQRTGWLSGLGNASYLGMILIGAVGVWFGYRVVNYSAFADFLIAVEAEMNKVSWPTRGELWRSALVVITVIFVLAFVLYFYDIFWVSIFSRVLGIT